MDKEIRIKAYTMQELAQLYQVNDRTIRRWLKPFRQEIGKREGHFFTLKQIRIIFEKIGEPEINS